MTDSTDHETLEIGWLGLGAMGSPMAAVAAAAGHHVTAFDLNPARAQDLADQGVVAAANAAQTAPRADVLVLMSRRRRRARPRFSATTGMTAPWPGCATVAPCWSCRPSA